MWIWQIIEFCDLAVCGDEYVVFDNKNMLILDLSEHCIFLISDGIVWY